MRLGGARDPGESLGAAFPCNRGGDSRLPGDAFPEPDHEFVVRDGVIGDAHDQLKDGGAVRVEAVAAAPEHQFDEQERSALVAVGETVVLHESVQQGGGLLVNAAMVAAVGASKGGMHGVRIEDAVATARGGKRLGVEVDGIGPSDPVVGISDRRARAGRRAGRR